MTVLHINMDEHQKARGTGIWPAIAQEQDRPQRLHHGTTSPNASGAAALALCLIKGCPQEGQTAAARVPAAHSLHNDRGLT